MSTDAIRDGAPYPGKAQVAFCRRIGTDWRDLAALLEIPASTLQPPGYEAYAIWDWLERRGRLRELPSALIRVDRQDLADLLRRAQVATPIAGVSFPDLEATSLIGRRRHLDWLRVHAAVLTAGRGKVLLVEGEPGVGKSTLVRAVATEVRAAGDRVVWLACDRFSTAFPLQPLWAMIDRLCEAGPAMLVVDDLQWADPATLQAIGRLIEPVRRLPLLLVGIARPLPRQTMLDTLRRALQPDAFLTLPSLSTQEVGEFVARAVGGSPGARLLRLAAGAAGNPLYLMELVGALVRTDSLSSRRGCVEATGRRTPTSLYAAIADRLDFLRDPVRRVLRDAALLGVEFHVSELSTVSNRRVNDLAPLLDEAIRAGVLCNRGHRLAFRHALIHAVMYRDMPPAMRSAWHRDAARALAKSGAPQEVVARQLLAGLDGVTPIDPWMAWWLAEAGHTLVAQAPRAAILLLRWATTGADRRDPPYDMLTCRLAEALYRVGQAAGAADVASRALARVVRPEAVVDLHWTLAQCRAMTGQGAQSLGDLRAALSDPDLDPPSRARLLALSARVYLRLGRLDAARRTAKSALVAARRARDRTATGWALVVLALVNGMRGNAARALPLCEQALAVADDEPCLADLRLVLEVNRAAALGALDRPNEALTAARHAWRLARDAGNIIRLAQARSVVAELLFDVGRWDEALSEVERGAGVSDDPKVACCNHGVAAAIALHRHAPGASRHLAAARPFEAILGGRVGGALTLAASLAQEQSGDLPAAMAVLIRGLTEEEEESADLLADVVRLAVAVGDAATASTVVERAERAANGSDTPRHQAVAEHCRGLLDADPARLLAAGSIYRNGGRVLPWAQTLEAASQASADRGDRAAAHRHLDAALALYTNLGARWDVARVTRLSRRYGTRLEPYAAA